MEASALVLAIRSGGGLSQVELARLAGVAPSTVSRIERGELEPTWAVMNRFLSSVGYRMTDGLDSAGDVSALVAARAVLGEFDLAAISVEARAWIERWERARFIDARGNARSIEKIAVQAGNASRVFSRPNTRLSVVLDRPWQEMVADLREVGIQYAVSGITATSPTRVRDGAAWPLLYVDSVAAAVAAARFEEQGTGGPRATLMSFDEVAATGLVVDEGIVFVSPGQALIDSYGGPGRMADQADAVASRWQASLAA